MEDLKHTQFLQDQEMEKQKKSLENLGCSNLSLQQVRCSPTHLFFIVSMCI